MRRSPALALVLLATAITAWTVALWLGLTRPPNVERFDLDDFIWGVGFMAFPIVGALIAWKRPEISVGWMFLVWPGVVGLGIMLVETINHVQAGATSWLAYSADTLFYVGVIVMAVYFLGIFPTGTFLPGRWQILRWSAIASIVASVGWSIARSCSVYVLAFPEPEIERPGCSSPSEPWFLRFENPIGVFPGGDALWDGIGAVGAVVGLIALAGGALQLVVRYRRGTYAERSQLKWLVVVLAVVVPLFLVMLVSDLVFSVDMERLSSFVFFAVLVGIPTAIGLAILRYRLYDVDRIINRTVSYGIVVGLLLLVFATGVVWLPTLLGTEDNGFLVAGSTLAVAALFNPLRTRVQRVVDHRFNRTRYDLDDVTRRFGSDMRDRVRPGEIVESWQRVVAGTLQPASIGTWVRGG